MSKKLVVMALAILLVGGTGCSLWSKKSSTVAPKDDQTTVKAPVPANTVVVAAPKDCGQDAVCGNALLAECAPGKFVAVDGTSKVYIEVKSKSGETCVTNQGVALADMGGFGGDYDTNKDGKISMDCNTPTTIKDFKALSEYMKTPVALAACTGELRKLGDDMSAIK